MSTDGTLEEALRALVAAQAKVVERSAHADERTARAEERMAEQDRRMAEQDRRWLELRAEGQELKRVGDERSAEILAVLKDHEEKLNELLRRTPARIGFGVSGQAEPSSA